MLNLLVWAAWGTVLLWAFGALLTLHALTRQKPLEPAAPSGPLMTGDAPLVSILVPARNEEHRVLDHCIRSFLSQDYGRFEVVAVNDRSTDATASILRAIARADERLKVVEGVEPPAGWLGKPHALQEGFEASSGEWALATDADMIFEKTAVRTAVAHALKGNYDAVTLIPSVVCLSFWERVFMPAFGWFMLMVLPVHRVNDPRRPESLGVGGFFLIRRAALKGVGEYGAVRAEVAEDLRMGEILKGAGARLRLEYAPALASTRMQTNFREIWEGFTKNLFAGAKFNLFQTLAGGIAVTLFAVAPLLVAVASLLALLAGAQGEWLRLFVPTFIVWTIQVAIFALINRWSEVPVAYAFTVPLGYALFVAILFNSAVRIATGRGVTWKGRRLYERAGVRPPRGTPPTPDLPVADE
ncbi:MAG: glycosyltransferase [Pyrinomonadaceae bacterium]